MKTPLIKNWIILDYKNNTPCPTYNYHYEGWLYSELFLLAARQAKTINLGSASRFSYKDRTEYCLKQHQELFDGVYSETSLYILPDTLRDHYEFLFRNPKLNCERHEALSFCYIKTSGSI